MNRHQYIQRSTGKVLTEKLFADRMINALYGPARENVPKMFKALTSARFSSILGFLNYDLSAGQSLTGARRLVKDLGLDLSECVAPASAYTTARKVFERQIRYWDCRPMPASEKIVVSPADAKMLAGSFRESDRLFIKEKFFDFNELLGLSKDRWHNAFAGGDFAVFRLTPEKYHYNHAPVSGRVEEIYHIEGRFHACNPGAVVTMVTPFSKNRRVVTVMDTDVPGGSRVGRVAMIEVVALMIGDILQCYSHRRYESPKPLRRGMFLRRGQVKSLYRPGSSVDILIFQAGRIDFCRDILDNLNHPTACSRYSQGFGRSLVETEVAVRAPIATRRYHT